MSDTNDAASKTEEPTPHKLAKAREKGDVAKSQDLAPLLALAAVAAVLVGFGGWISRNMAAGLLPFIAHPEDIEISGAGAVEVARMAVMAAAPALGLVLFAAALAGVAGNLMQHGLLFTTEKLKPDLKKVSPLEGFKRLFGPDNLFNFGKSLVKIALVGVVSWWIVRPHLAEFPTLSALDPAAVLPFSVQILKKLLFAVIALMLVITGVDWLYQRQRFMEKMRMSKEELKEEFKQTDGDPHVKARQKQIRAERARRRMMQAVPTATVVVMNPTHYAVALKYEEGESAAPVCVAKGLDSLALKIREVAEAAGVPIEEDPPLARALYAAVEVDEAIPPRHYEAVARIIGFILQNRRSPVKSRA